MTQCCTIRTTKTASRWPPTLPSPSYALALETRPRGQEQKLAAALARLIEEEPCLSVEHHKAPNGTVVRGLSELHLRVMLERVRERYGVEVTTRPVETITD